jgi:Putative Actinobacterial Holin-X, holin superfamily III
MADQATLMNRNASATNGAQTRSPADRGSSAAEKEPGAGDMVSNVAGFGENLLTLGELQARLVARELIQNYQAARTAGTVGLVGILVAVSGIPVVLLGIAELLVSELAMKRGFALLSVAAAAIVLGGGVVAFVGTWLRQKRLGFPVSTEELTRNLNWLRTVLRYSGRIPRGR